MNKTRPNKLTLRLSDAELAELNSRVKSSGFNQQQYLAKAIFEKNVIEKSSCSGLLFELRKQGVNLNQIARVCNLGHFEEERKRITDVLSRLESLWQSLRLLM